jgi:thiopurine S-methyltransferase
MEPDFWHDRWREGRIGFHEGRPNTFLTRHGAHLGEAGRVLVPLAGKSHDMVYLAEQGHQVVGVELSPLAVQSFFGDHGLAPTRQAHGPFEAFSAGPITLLLGDIFALDPAHLGPDPLTAVYDRAALIALPPDLRRRYAAHLRQLMPAGARGLVVTFDYPQEMMDGPPFSVAPGEVAALFSGLTLAELDSAMADLPRLREAGNVAIERCFTLTF